MDTERRAEGIEERRCGGMKKQKENMNLATEILSDMKKRLNVWRLVAVASIALNIIQWLAK